MEPGRTSSRRQLIILGILALVAFAALTLRNTGVVPFVFMDEYGYSMSARLLPLSAAILPDYLYFAVFRISNVCGPGFIDCVRALNVGFFLASAPFIFLTARRVADEKAALWVTALAVVGPLNSYTVYFMPEASYFFGFWVITWLATGLTASSGIVRWAILGCAVGAMALVKPHALFLLPALACFAAYQKFCWSARGLLDTVLVVVALVVATLVVKLGLGFALAGRPGLSLFGAFYGGMAGTSVQGLEHYTVLLRSALVSLKGHMMIVVYSFGLAVAACVVSIARGGWKRATHDQASSMGVFTLLMLGSLLCMVALLTGSLTVSGGPDELLRLHQRYYDFALPLLLICAAIFAGDSSQRKPERLSGVLCWALAAAVVYVFVNHLREFRPGLLDGPCAFGLTTSLTAFRIVGYLMFLVLVAWPFVPHMAARGFFWIVLPMSTLLAGYMVNSELSTYRVPLVYERAATVARLAIPPGEQGQAVVLATYASEGYRTLFTLDNAEATFLVKPDRQTLTWAELPAGKQWIIAVGDHDLPEGAVEQTRMPGFSIGRAPRAETAR